MRTVRDGSTSAKAALTDRASVDLSQLRNHCRAEHAPRHGQRHPRSNADLSAWHAGQHHRYSSSTGHIHGGPWVLITQPGRASTAGQIARPLGWYTGQLAVTSAQLREQFLNRIKPRSTT